MREIWKKISYSPDCEVSSEGNVRKVLGNGKYAYKKFYINNGYKHVSISIQRDLAKYTTQVKRVALLVAEAFLYNPGNDRNVVYVNADASPIDSVKNIIWSPYRKLMNNGKIEHEILDRVCIDSIIYRDLDIACNVTGLNKDRLKKALDAGRLKFKNHDIC